MVDAALLKIGGLAAAGGAAALTGLRVGDFRAVDALRLAQDVQRSPVVLTLDLTRPLRPTGGGLAALRARGRPTLREVLDALDHAARDERVVGLLGRVGSAPGSLATVQELAAAIGRLRASGTPTVAHAETFGEGGNATLAYLLASAFEEIHLQPSGSVSLQGVASEVTFLRDALDKLGIEPELDHRHEYKNVIDAFTQRGFTEAHREALSAVVADWSDQIVTAVADRRGMDVDAVRDAMDHAPLLPEEALERGLVDRLAYRDETLDTVREAAGSQTQLSPLTEYHQRVAAHRRWRARGAPLVGLIDAQGTITQRTGGGPATPGISSDVLGAAFRRAAEDDDVAAVVLSIDSPGGSAVASDVIRRAIHQTRQAGKPVIAWMRDVAGSGGYYIGMPADHIVARPGTVTGSIGVAMGKVVTSGLAHRLGLVTEAVAVGDHARFFSSASSFTDRERARLDAQLDHVYEDFTAKVAADRGLSREQVDAVARGRIWTGAQAHARGLVDELGGYPEVLAAVRDRLGLAADAPLRVHRYPPSPSLLDRLRGQAHDDPAERELTGLLAAAGDPAVLLDAVAAWTRPAGVLQMPVVPRPR
jgi:protease-4